MTTEAPPAPADAPAQLETPPATPAPAAAPPASTPPAETPPASETPPAATTTPAFSPDGKLGENWFLALGDEFAAHAKDLGKHKDIRSLITELDYFRKNGAEYPSDTSPQTAVDRFRKIAGVPDSPEGYGLTAEAMKLPEGMSFDNELAAAVAQAAHRTHTPPAALNAVVGVFNEILAKRTADAAHEVQKAHEASKAALVAEWRGDFQANASTVRHITSKLAEQAGILPDDPAIAEFIGDISAKPALAKLMLQVSKLTSEDRISTPTGFGDMRSPSQQIEDIKAGKDPTWSPLWNSKNDAERLKAYEYVNALRAKANG